MAGTDDLFYERALRRIGRAIVAIAVGGTAAALAWGGWNWSAGFGLGAGASWLNYRWLAGIAGGLGGEGRTRTRLAVLAGLRYLLLGLGAYVIVRFSKVSVTAALAGLFVPVAAVMLEMLYQLVYARD